MNTIKTVFRGLVLLMMVTACLLLSGCFIIGGDHFLWF